MLLFRRSDFFHQSPASPPQPAPCLAVFCSNSTIFAIILPFLLDRIFRFLGPSLHHRECFLMTHPSFVEGILCVLPKPCKVLRVDDVCDFTRSLSITPMFTLLPTLPWNFCTVSVAALLGATFSERVCSTVGSTLFSRAVICPRSPHPQNKEITTQLEKLKWFWKNGPLLRCCGLSSCSPPKLNLNFHPDPRVLLEI